MTWKQKYACWVNSSTWEFVVQPASLAQSRITIGTIAMRMARATAGRRPETTPRTTYSVSLGRCVEDRNTYLRNLLNPGEAGQGFECIHGRDDTDNTNGDSPKDDEDSDEGIHCIASDNNLPPRNAKAFPNNVIRSDTDSLRSHVKRLVVGDGLIGSLSSALGIKFDEDGIDGLTVAGKVLRLLRLHLGDELLQLVASPFDGVDFLAKETKETETVRGALVVRDPSRGNVASLGIIVALLRRLLLLLSITILLGFLGTSLVDSLDKLDFCLFKLHGGIVAVTNGLIELRRISSNPDVLDSVGEHGAEPCLVEIVVWDVGKEDGAGRDAASIVGVVVKGVAQVDIEDDFASNHVHDEAIHSPADKDVGIVVMRMCVDVNVAE